MPNEYQEYQDQMEEWELRKREGITAWADHMTEVMGVTDPDKKILIREGLLAMVMGPPPMKFPNSSNSFIVPPKPPIDAEFKEPKPRIYEYADQEGNITVYDWICISSRGTHATWHPDQQTVTVWRGREVFLYLHGPPARAFWEWRESLPSGLAVVPGRLY
jgi:hypothetical protein